MILQNKLGWLFDFAGWIQIEQYPCCRRKWWALSSLVTSSCVLFWVLEMPVFSIASFAVPFPYWQHHISSHTSSRFRHEDFRLYQVSVQWVWVQFQRNIYLRHLPLRNISMYFDLGIWRVGLAHFWHAFLHKTENSRHLNMCLFLCYFSFWIKWPDFRSMVEIAYRWKHTKTVIFQFLTVINNNVTDTWVCVAGALVASFTVSIPELLCVNRQYTCIFATAVITS